MSSFYPIPPAPFYERGFPVKHYIGIPVQIMVFDAGKNISLIIFVFLETNWWKLPSNTLCMILKRAGAISASGRLGKPARPGLFNDIVPVAPSS